MNTDALASPRKVNITLVIDRSGSMEALRSDVVGGINQFIESQRAQPGDATLTMITFDSGGMGMSYDVIVAGMDIRRVRRLTMDDYVPRGSTPLYDAIGRAITEVDARGPQDLQLLAIFTDGKNNASRLYDKAQIFEMITARRARGWVVTLAMANEDAYAEGAAMGFARGATQAWAGDGRGAQEVYRSFAANTTSLRHSYAGGQSVNTDDFFESAGKAAEDDLLDRKPESPAAQAVKADASVSTE